MRKFQKHVPSSTIFSKFTLSDSQVYSVLMLLRVLNIHLFSENMNNNLKILQKRVVIQTTEFLTKCTGRCFKQILANETAQKQL